MISNPSIYTDLQSLTQLRAQAQQNSPEALRAVAKQFEGLLMQMMLKSMRDASMGDGLMDSEQTDFYQGMFDQQLSLTLAHGRGLGLANMLIKQLGGDLADTTKERQPGVTNSSFPFPARLPLLSFPVVSPQVSNNSNSQPLFTSPAEFVKSLWPLAQHTGKVLGVAPQAILAQAALETGWGQAIMQRPDGSSTHNLFGIKADSRWQGERVVMPTLEYTHGKAGKRNELFRSYDSYAASFADYANFLRSNPRYSQVLLSGENPALFTQALQAAGYATDPDYSLKINNIINSPAITARLKQLPLQGQAEVGYGG
jgi:flagellar protein FlgJ